MITNKNRATFWGASETSMIVGNWDTQTFMQLFLVKLGVRENNFKNKYTLAGNSYERKIAESLGIKLKFDRCIKKRNISLRVNLDAESKDCIYEIKTHKDEWKKVPTNYIQQCQVQMWITGKHKCKIVAYKMEEDNYENFFLGIEKDRIEIYDIPYDQDWINNIYLPKLKYLSYCIKHKQTPNKNKFEEFGKEKK
ncbi:MAG: hypothetical protein EOL97_09835 [Spirochaetia bacterium]|nr:hypothetical protein [Spirochaetia bacterium]